MFDRQPGSGVRVREGEKLSGEISGVSKRLQGSHQPSEVEVTFARRQAVAISQVDVK
jgi:hypothetical protein